MEWKQFGISTLKREALFMITVWSSILEVRKRKKYLSGYLACYQETPAPIPVLRPTPFAKPRKSPNSYHWIKQALLQESLLLPFSQRHTIIQVFLPSRILLMVDVFPLKNFPRKQTLIGNGGNCGGGGGSYKKREEQITFHHNFKYGKTKSFNFDRMTFLLRALSLRE